MVGAGAEKKKKIRTNRYLAGNCLQQFICRVADCSNVWMGIDAVVIRAAASWFPPFLFFLALLDGFMFQVQTIQEKVSFCLCLFTLITSANACFGHWIYIYMYRLSPPVREKERRGEMKRERKREERLRSQGMGGLGCKCLGRWALNELTKWSLEKQIVIDR